MRDSNPPTNSREKFDDASEGAFLKWQTAIVENRIRDQRDDQKSARRDMGKQSPLENPRSDGSAIPLEIPDKSGLPTASRVMMLSVDMLRLEQALDHLPAETRELMIAIKLEGRTYQELADETGKTSDALLSVPLERWPWATPFPIGLDEINIRQETDCGLRLTGHTTYRGRS